MKKVLSLTMCLYVFSAFVVHAQNYHISSPDDDAEESAGFTTVSLNSEIIDLTADPTNPRNMKQLVGLRFTDVFLERGAPLANCYLVFHTELASSKISMLTISGEKAANAEVFQAVNRNLSSRIRTKARVNWNNVEAWNQAGGMMKSPDLSMVLSEIINQNDWKAGNALVLFIEGNGQRHATAFDKNPELAIQLVVNDPSGNRYRRPVVVQQPIVQPVSNSPDVVVQTDRCNIPELPVGAAKQAYMQGDAYMKNEDFKSAEARYSMGIDLLKHPKLFIARAAARQLLDRNSDAQSDLNQAIALGTDAKIAQKCFEDLVNSYKNFDTVHLTFEACFTRNVRNLQLPPCPIHVTLGKGKANLSMDTKYEFSWDKQDTYAGKPYNSIITTTNWVLNPGEYHDCNPNVDTSIRPANVKMTLSAKTNGWFEIPVIMSMTNTYMNGKEVVASKVTETNNWFLVGYLFKLHTGETTITGGFYRAEGGSAPLQIGINP